MLKQLDQYACYRKAQYLCSEKQKRIDRQVVTAIKDTERVLPADRNSNFIIQGMSIQKVGRYNES